MPPLDFDTEMAAHGIQVSAGQVREEFAGEAHSADLRTLQQQPPRALDLGRDKRPIEAGVVSDKHAAFERGEQTIDDRLEWRRVPDHPSIDTGQPGNELRDRDARIDEGMER